MAESEEDGAGDQCGGSADGVDETLECVAAEGELFDGGGQGE